MKSALLWIVAVIVAAVCAAGCFASVPPKPALSVLECRVHLLEPYFGEMAPEFVRATIGGKPELLVKSLDELGVSLEEILELSKAWKACNPARPAVGSQAAGQQSGGQAPPVTVEQN